MQTTRAKIFAAFFMFSLLIGSSLAHAQRIRIGYPSFAPGFIIGWVAVESGILKQHGLDPEIVYIRGGQQLVPALIGNSVDIALGSDTGTYGALLGGADLVKLGTTFNSLTFSFVGRPEIKGANSLRGARVGASRGRDLTYVSVLRVLSSYGLVPDKDVTILPVGAGDQERIQATLNGPVVGTILFPPWELQAERLGLKIISNNRIASLNGGINTTRSLLQSKRGLIKTFLRGYREASRYAQTHKEQTVSILQKYLKIPDRSIAEHMYNVTIPHLEPSLFPADDAVQSTLDIVAFTNPKAKETKTSDFWDVSLLKELDAEVKAKK